MRDWLVRVKWGNLPRVSLDDLRASLLTWAATGSYAELGRRVGRPRQTVSQIAAGTLVPSAALHAQLEAAVTSSPPSRRSVGRPPTQSLAALWDDLEARSPTWESSQRVLREAQCRAYAFAQRPRDQRACTRRAARGCCPDGWLRALDGARTRLCPRCQRCRCEPCQSWRQIRATWRVAHVACRPASCQILGMESHTERRRIKKLQLDGLLPAVIYPDDDEQRDDSPRLGDFRIKRAGGSRSMALCRAIGEASTTTTQLSRADGCQPASFRAEVTA